MSTPDHECQESHNANDVCPTTTTTVPVTATTVPVTTPTTVPTTVVTQPPPVPSLPVTGAGIGTESVLVLGLVMVAAGAIIRLRERAERLAC
jgi:LPXTG-motif cell wall-anchored protein